MSGDTPYLPDTNLVSLPLVTFGANRESLRNQQFPYSPVTDQRDGDTGKAFPSSSST